MAVVPASQAPSAAMACAGSSAGRMPSVRVSEPDALHGLLVGGGQDLQPAGLEERRELGADARVVEPGRDGVRLRHLAVRVLEEVRARAVQDPRGAAREGRGVPACQALPCRLDPHQAHRRLPDEAARAARWRSSRRRRRPSPRRAVGPPPRAPAARASSPMTRWRSRTSAGKGCGPTAEPEDVVGGGHVRDPVAHRLVHGVLERARCPRSPAAPPRPSARMRRTLGAWRRMSSAPMYTTHSRSSSAQAVAVATPCWPAPVSAMTRGLPSRRVSSAWPERVVDLVGARVVEVLALEVEAQADRHRGRPAAQAPRRGGRHGRRGVGRPT